MELPMMTEMVDVCTVQYSWCWTHAATERLKYGECNRGKEYLILIHLHLNSHIRPAGDLTFPSPSLLLCLTRMVIPLSSSAKDG